MLGPRQPLQTDHKDGPYSDMQVAHAGGGEIIAKQMGIEVLAFKFKETEVSEMEPTYPTGALKFKEIKRVTRPPSSSAWCGAFPV